MSFQRILETARRLGTPVIFSDVAGREPMVLLPLDVFEAMSAGSGASGQLNQKSEPKIEPTVGPALPAFEEAPPSNTETFVPVSKMQNTDESGNGLSMEDRFYLEPLEEESK